MNVTEEFAQLTIELIDEFIVAPNATWVTVNDNAEESNKPYRFEQPVTTETLVKILFDRDDLENRQMLRYGRETAFVDGQVNGWMYPYQGLEPKLKDTVIWNGRVLNVNAIDPIQPIDYPILYFIEFGT